MRRGIWLLSLSLAVGAAGVAQQPEVTHAPDRHGNNAIAGGGLVPPILGTPFTARTTLLIKILLPNGTTIQQRSSMFLARDSMGSVYRERRKIVALAEETEPRLEASIVYDRLAGTKTVCETALHVCTVTNERLPMRPTAEQEGPSKDGRMTLTRTFLGNETLEGIEVQHYRETRTFATGVMGNDKPISSVIEYWYSPLLQIDIATLRINPQGSSMYQRLKEISFSEPESAQFAPTEGFRIVDARLSK